MKKVLAVLLSALVVILAIAPFMVGAFSTNDAYAVIFTASDFQSTSCYSNLTEMMQSAQKDGITEVPDAFLFGGDYTSGSEDPAVQVPKVIETVQSVYSGYDESNMIFVQGNHDSANEVLTPTGLYKYENFVVYVINEDDFTASQGSKSGYDGTVKALAAKVANELTIMKQNGDNRPVFIATHVPLHHSSRSSYGDNLYSKHLFDVLNEFGNDLDIIFLFGHNHSNNFDDYIGGAVNYIAKGETIRIPIPDTTQMGENGYTEETLNFTYMNYGYVGYSNNVNSDTSTKTLTMGAFELCPTTIEISRYSTTGVYTTEKITRVTPMTTEPYIRINGETTGVVGNSGILYGAADNIEDPSYSWTTSDDSVLKLLPAGKNTNVIYTGAGSADVILTVTDKDGKSYSKSFTIIVTGDSTYVPQVSFKKGTLDIDGQKLKIYDVVYGDGFMIDGTFTGFGEKVNNVTTSWVSTNPAVATVENGYVTYISSGEATITYVVTDGTTTITKSVDLYISRATKPIDRYVLTSTVEAGKSYVIANVNTTGAAMVMGAPQIMSGTQARMSAISANIETNSKNELNVHISTDAAVWNAVSASDGYVYLVNEQYGTYLYCSNDADGSTVDLGLTTDETKNGAKWVVNASGFLIGNDSNRGIQYSSEGNFRGSSEASITKQFIYEKTETAPFVTLKMNNANVDGVTEVIYSVTDSTTRTLKGTYANFGEDAVVNWVSSDNDIATVDENGVVSFTGEPGIVDITYLVTDENNLVASATITFDSRVTKEPVRVFKYTETIEPGKKYIAVSSKNVGAAYLMLSTHKSSSYLAQQYAVIQPDSSDGNVYIEVVKDDLAPVWVVESTDTDGYYYLVSEDDGTYLWAGTTENAVSTDASLSTYDAELYKWTYDGSTLYNQQIDEATSKYTGIKISSSGYFRITKPAESESSKLYLFEETELVPYVHIRSKYVNVENTTMSRNNVSPFQTETLMGKTENFPSSDFVNYEWTSSNTSVATIDNAGVVTYTGNPGITTITVVATSTVPNEDGTYSTATSKVNIKVLPQTLTSVDSFVLTNNFVPGESYLIVNSNSVGTAYLMTNTPYVDSSEHRLKSSSCDVEQLDTGLTIINSENSNVWKCIESDTEGYYYLINEATGEYLALVADRDYSPYRRVITTETLDEYDHEAYLITRSTGNQIYSKQSKEYASSSQAEPNILRMDAGKNYDFRLSWSSDKMYIYQRLSSETAKPKTEIRVSSFLGTTDITNTLQNRYNIMENDTEQLLRYTEGFANITRTKWSVSDESIATINENGLLTYTGKEGFVTVTLDVTGKDALGESVTHTVRTTLNVSNDDYESPTNDYPQYPHEGSVRINKTASSMAGGYNFQTSGVTEVELSVTGVPLSQAVDVVVVFDHSSSMNSGGRLTSAIEDTREFALQVVNANRNNRIAIVTFDRYRENYDSITDTTANYTTNASSTEDRIITGDGTAEGAFMTLNDSEELIAQIDSLAYNSIAGTNYDYGLQEAYNILSAAKSDPNANKMQYVVFMSDGEPYVYNRVKVVYGDEDADGSSEAWLRGDESNSVLAGYLADTTTYPAAQYFNTRGDNWYSEIIKTPEGQTLSDMPAVDYYDGYRTGLGATMFTIGYGAGEPGSLTRDVLATMASTEDNYYYASGNLQEAYDSILKKIIFAANNAVVTDKMGENFQLQFAPSLTLDNGMATLTFEPAPYIEIGSWTLNSDGTRNKYTSIETITFETDVNGKLTAAYSNLMGSQNIYNASTNKIVGSKVTYDITNEKFSWNVGDITRDEVTLKYYAYLEGSAEGEREAGTFDTNEYAKIDYINYRGVECSQTFPVPSLAWKDAVVNYEFYLVNENGEPVNKDGVVVPFAERVLVGQEKTEKLVLNSSGDYSALNLIAKEKVPAGYILFNEDTSYRVAVSSGDNPSKATIYDDAAVKTTYFRDGNILYSGHGDVPNVTDYMNTHVSFAILRVGGIAPDSVVIDYGLPVKISVLSNDVNANKGVLNAIGTTLMEDTELNNVPYTESRLQNATKTGLILPNGTASINGSQVVYTPSNLTMNTENAFYYEYLTDEGLYMYAEITVIPAANIYYEESFFTFNDGDGYTWQTAGEEFDNKFQAEDRPGTFSFADIDANNVYGMDHAYDDSYTYSLGSAMYASVDADAYGKEPTAEFTFCGTGFDLFSVTNNNTGAVLVSIYKEDETTLYKNYIVQTYYGYSYEVDEEGNGAFVPNPDSDGCLYQVPVISARDLGYDTYRVVIKPLYSTMFDTAKDGSYDIYVDSVRIYNPAGQKPDIDSVIGDAYIEDNEYNPHFIELRRTILDSETFYDDVYELDSTLYSQGSIFIDSIGSLDSNGISDKYRDAGPNNEVYLAKGQAIAFHLVSDEEIAPTSVELGMKTVFGNSSEVALMNTNDLTPRYVTVSGAHEMYRRLASVIVWDENELATTGMYKTKYPIVIVNTSDSILSLTNLKWAFTSEEAEGELQVVVNSETPMLAYETAKSVMAPFPYTNEDIQMEWSDTSLKEGAEVTLTITTPADIAKITIDGIEITEYTVDGNGNKVWIYTFTVVESGENTYDVLLYANNGKVSQPMVTETITVAEDNGVVNPFNAIIELIKRIIQFFRNMFI